MKFKTVLAAAAALSAVASPVAAQADTTAAAATGKITNVSGMGVRQSTPVRGKQKADAGTYVLIGGAAILVGYGLSKVLDDNKSNGS